jgi:hypothetical protein
MEKGIPYHDLYVYEVSGEISDSKTFFREDFIGCWNEREISCLFFSAPHDHEVQAFIQKRRFRLLSRNVMDYKSWQAGEIVRQLNEKGFQTLLTLQERCWLTWLGVRTG